MDKVQIPGDYNEGFIQRYIGSDKVLGKLIRGNSNQDCKTEYQKFLVSVDGRLS